MDFAKICILEDSGFIKYPTAAWNQQDGWVEGYISLDFLEEHFGQYETLDECIQATESEGLKLFFESLKQQE